MSTEWPPLVHPEVIFKNVSDGEVDAEAAGDAQFRELAHESKALFSSRRRKATAFRFSGDSVTVHAAYEGVLAVDLPNGMKTGEVLRLNGRSEFELKDGKLFRITDFS